MNIKSLIRTIPNYPKPGIMFRDISTLLYNGKALQFVTESFYKRYYNSDIQAIAGIESRGFIFGAMLASKMGISFIPLRNKGKLPCDVYSEEYSLEYGIDTIEIDKSAIKEKDNIVIIDDLIATGGTALAAISLILRCKANIYEVSFLIDLPDLLGRKKIEEKGFKTFSLIEFKGK